MGKGKRILDLRNLNLDNFDSKNDKKKIDTSIKEDEFIIEVEEKPKKKKFERIDHPIAINDADNKKQKSRINRKIKKQKSPKSYIEKEEDRKSNHRNI